MISTQNYWLVWKGFCGRDNNHGLMSLKLLKYPEVSIKVVVRSWCYEVWVNFPEIPLFVTLLLISFMMIPANSLNMENTFLIELQ